MTAGEHEPSPTGGGGPRRRLDRLTSAWRPVVDSLKWTLQSTAKLVGLLVWLVVGVVFWIPLLIRRLLLFVLEVLVAGFIGGDTALAARQLNEAVRFYWTGIERITSAFDPGDERHEARVEYAERRRRPKPGRRALYELLWASFFWGAMAWAVGLWPEAPQVLVDALATLWDLAADLGRRLRRWWFTTFPQ